MPTSLWLQRLAGGVYIPPTDFWHNMGEVQPQKLTELAVFSRPPSLFALLVQPQVTLSSVHHETQHLLWGVVTSGRGGYCRELAESPGDGPWNL